MTPPQKICPRCQQLRHPTSFMRLAGRRVVTVGLCSYCQPETVAIDGMAVPLLNRLGVGSVDIGRDLARYNPRVLRSRWNANAWLRGMDGWIDRQLEHVGPFVAIGFSAGAPAAARLAERDSRCQGLIYISGFALKHQIDQMRRYVFEGSTYRWTDLPVLCLSTEGENARLLDGVRHTAAALKAVGADVTYDGPAPNPGTHRRPHLAGIAHHRPAIDDWWGKHFGGCTA